MTQRQSILLVSEVFPPMVGGSGVLLENVYSRIDTTDVVVLTTPANAAHANGHTGRMRLLPSSINRNDWGLLSLPSLKRHVSVARQIYRRAAHGQAIVHCGRAQPEGIPALFASRFPGGPQYVFWAHGEEITTSLTSRDFHAAMRLVYRGATAVIANSRNTAVMLAKEGIPPSRIHVVHPGVDAARFEGPPDLQLRSRIAEPGDLVLLSVARLQRRKGHDLVLAALASLMSSHPQLKYVIVGDGDERERLESLAIELGVGSRVYFAGEVPHEELPSYFRAADIFVLPTRVDAHDFEGFGIVYLEAAAAGLPTIGGRNGGVPEAVAEGKTGLLVSGTDAEELVAAIARLADSEALRRQFGAAGRRRAAEEFTWSRAARAVVELQDDLCARS